MNILILFVFGLCAVNCATVHNSDVSPCVINHLKNINFLNSTFSPRLEEQKRVKCDSVVESYSEAFQQEIRTQLKAKDNETCIMKVMQDHKIFELFLKGLVFHSLKLTNILNFKREASETTRDFLEAAREICTAIEKYGEAFDEAYDERNESVDSVIDKSTNLCIQKYYFEHKIINSADFDIDANTINATSCKEIIKTLEDEDVIGFDESLTFYGLSSVEAQKCHRELFSKQKIVLKIASFEIVLRLKFSDEKKNKLRNDYIKAMAANVQILLDCLSKLH